MTVEASVRSELTGRADDVAAIAGRTRGAVVLAHVPFVTQIDLRLAPSSLGRSPYPLPTTPNTVWEEGRRAALWLGPDEWLVLGPPGAGSEIVAELETALAGVHRSIVDVSANREALELSGSGAKEILSQGCALDLHPRTWRPGMCAQTSIARTQVTLHEREATTGILVRASFAGYLLDWLLDAIEPYRLT